VATLATGHGDYFEKVTKFYFNLVFDCYEFVSAISWTKMASRVHLLASSTSPGIMRASSLLVLSLVPLLAELYTTGSSRR